MFDRKACEQRMKWYQVACVTMNDHWGYCARDKHFKPASMLIKKLVECVSKNGNLLLNVGPDARGNIPQRIRDAPARSLSGDHGFC